MTLHFDPCGLVQGQRVLCEVFEIFGHLHSRIGRFEGYLFEAHPETDEFEVAWSPCCGVVVRSICNVLISHNNFGRAPAVGQPHSYDAKTLYINKYHLPMLMLSSG